MNIHPSLDISQNTSSVESTLVPNTGFAAHSRITMSDGSLKFVNQIRKGDTVKNGYKVLCVVRTMVSKRINMISIPSGPCITPWNPVKISNPVFGIDTLWSKPNTAWVFPLNITGVKNDNMFLKYYYNFVLDRGHMIRIGQYDACTLGHGIQVVIDDLKKNTADWNNELIVRTDDVATRQTCGY